uniref:Uncharacterized protein n=1 Tax=Glossina pallidipes TaxID=7398 RepID=A0A1A9Z2Q2_GLOPL
MRAAEATFSFIPRDKKNLSLNPCTFTITYHHHHHSYVILFLNDSEHQKFTSPLSIKVPFLYTNVRNNRQKEAILVIKNSNGTTSISFKINCVRSTDEKFDTFKPSRVLFPVNNGTPSMNKGRLPSLAIKKSPLLRNLIVPCLRDILVAGPSKDKSTSTMQSLASRPNDISFERIR